MECGIPHEACEVSWVDRRGDVMADGQVPDHDLFARGKHPLAAGGHHELANAVRPSRLKAHRRAACVDADLVVRVADTAPVRIRWRLAGGGGEQRPVGSSIRRSGPTRRRVGRDIRPQNSPSARERTPRRTLGGRLGNLDVSVHQAQLGPPGTPITSEPRPLFL
jgi:hypothetical protein